MSDERAPLPMLPTAPPQVYEWVAELESENQTLRERVERLEAALLLIDELIADNRSCGSICRVIDEALSTTPKKEEGRCVCWDMDICYGQMYDQAPPPGQCRLASTTPKDTQEG